MPAGRSPTTSGETGPACPTSAADGKPCLNKDGYAGWKATFDERGNETSVAYFGSGRQALPEQGWLCRMEGPVRRARETRQACPTSAPTASPA